MIIKISGNEIKAKQIDLISESRFSEILQFLVDKKGQATLRDLKELFLMKILQTNILIV